MINLVSAIEKDIYKVRANYLSWGLRCNTETPSGKARQTNARYATDALQEAREIVTKHFNEYFVKHNGPISTT